MTTKTKVYLEVGDKRTFASAVDWPGWSRAGRDREEALGSLLEHGQRYGAAIKGAARFTAPTDVSSFEVVGRLKGAAGTDFGVPSRELPGDGDPVSPAELKRLTAILDAAWLAFDASAERHRDAELRKGPRGGGRDLQKIVGHVFEADEAYCHQIGSRRPKAEKGEDPAAATARLRQTIRDALAARVRGTPIADPNKVKKPWSPRYLVRRSAWHALDHAWEIEDRAI